MLAFYIEYENEVTQLPVNPESITINGGGSNRAEEIVGLGEVNILRTKKLETLSISSFLPAHANTPYTLTNAVLMPLTRFKQPMHYIRLFEKIRDDKKPFRLLITGLDVNRLMAIDSLDYGYEGGDPDIHYTINLRAFVYNSAKQLEIVESGGGETLVKVPTKERESRGDCIGDDVQLRGNMYEDAAQEILIAGVENIAGRIRHIRVLPNGEKMYLLGNVSNEVIGWAKLDDLRAR